MRAAIASKYAAFGEIARLKARNECTHQVAVASMRAKGGDNTIKPSKNHTQLIWHLYSICIAAGPYAFLR